MSAVISKSNMSHVRQKLQHAINAALAELDPKLHGELGRITFNPGKDFRVKLSVSNDAALSPFGDGTKGSFNDLGRDVLVGSKFLFRGKEYTVTGFNYRNYKYPVIARGPSARKKYGLSAPRSFKFALDTIRNSVSLNDNSEATTFAFKTGLRPR